MLPGEDQTSNKYDFIRNKEEGQPVESLFANSESFCNALGYPVNHNSDCYDGVPTANRLKLSQGKRAWNYIKNKSTVKKTMWESLQLLLNFRLVSMFFFYLSILASVFFAFYYINLWQVKKEKEEAERQAREDRIAKVNKRRKERKEERLRLQAQLDSQVKALEG